MFLPLSFSPVATTTSVDETEALFAEQLVNSHIMKAGNGKDFAVSMNAVTLGACTLSTLHHSSDYKIDCGDIDNTDSVIFGFGAGSSASTNFGGREVALNNNGVIITSHSKVAHNRTGGSYEFVLRISAASIRERLQQRLDRHVSRQITFGDSVNLESEGGQQARSSMFAIFRSLDANPELLANKVVAANFEEILSNTVLSLPNSYSEALTDSTSISIAPSYVIKAEDYLESHAHLPVTMDDVLRYTGCSKNTLFKSFRRFRNYTPWEFLTTTRLNLVRTRLQQASESDNVKSIALDFGFTHAGRFSKIYRELYGEKPSETLSRAVG